MMKRALDVITATVGLVVLSPLLVAIALLVRLDSPGPGLYRGLRIGRNGRTFKIVKFRSMNVGSGEAVPITAADDPRITGFGRRLRRHKIDELPQLLNVLKGEMSLVGPRPEDPEFVAAYSDDQRRVLEVRPGITGPAAIAFHNEEALLDGGNARQRYLEDILPRKLAMDLDYVNNHSVVGDLVLIARTIELMVDVSQGFQQLKMLIRRWLPWMLIDALVVALSFYVALLLRFAESPPGLQQIVSAALAISMAPLIGIYLLSNHTWRLDRRVWRYATAPEAIAIFASVVTATAVAILTDIMLGYYWIRPLPLSLIVLGGLLTFCGMVGVRYQTRLLHGLGKPERGDAASRKPTLIYGAGNSGQFVAWRVLTDADGRSFRLVGFIDDDPSKRGQTIHGVRVLGGRADLPYIVAANDVELIILAMSNVSGEDLRAIISAAQETPAQIRIVPNLIEQMSKPKALPLLREVRVEDLLGRQPAIIDLDACEKVLAHKTVLVTGGCGSVGSELCRQVVAFDPLHLVVVDNNETGIFDLEFELRELAPGLRMTLIVGDVADEAKMRRIFDETRPRVIFHAAAYKHVPLMELYPEEAVRVNVQGTLIALDNAARVGAECFVLVSTDKAVNPSSVMGATKRISELLLLNAARAARVMTSSTRVKNMTRYTAVRFGNVLGSRGSVVPTFSRQIDAGGPVTVTHPDMTRYFMDVAEAASLIIQAASLTSGGDVFMLDMGERIKVDDLARKMIRMRGLRADLDIKIVYTGVRPGEKLHEQLMLEAEQRRPTAHPLIFKLSDPQPERRGGLRSGVAGLLDLAGRGSQDEVARAVLELAREETPTGDEAFAGNVLVVLPVDREKGSATN
jgi:FlaA1/EpsC-like NDP-sugar epimerase/lipopolysaccharide/colanic/teichoic acid biosynthesis glycosyltransferase